MDLLAPLHPVADVVDLASDAVTALALVIMTAAARWLLPSDSVEYPPLHVVDSGSVGHRRPNRPADGSTESVSDQLPAAWRT